VGEHFGIYAVVLDPGRRDRPNFQRMGKQNFLAHVIELVKHRSPAVTCLQDRFERLIVSIESFFEALSRTIYANTTLRIDRTFQKAHSPIA
jgi:hypothetical protein